MNKNTNGNKNTKSVSNNANDKSITDTGKQIVAYQVSSDVSKELLLLGLDAECKGDSMQSLLNVFDSFVVAGEKLYKRIGRVFHQAGHESQSSTHEKFKEIAKEHYGEQIKVYVGDLIAKGTPKDEANKNWSQTPAYKNALKPIAAGRKWVFPKIDTKEESQKKLNDKVERGVTRESNILAEASTSSGGQASVNACHTINNRMRESNFAPSGTIICTEAWREQTMQRLHILNTFLVFEMENDKKAGK